MKIFDFINNALAVHHHNSNQSLLISSSRRYERMLVRLEDRSFFDLCVGSFFLFLNQFVVHQELPTFLQLQYYLVHPSPFQYFYQRGSHFCIFQEDFRCNLHLFSSMGCFQFIHSDLMSEDTVLLALSNHLFDQGLFQDQHF